MSATKFIEVRQARLPADIRLSAPVTVGPSMVGQNLAGCCYSWFLGGAKENGCWIVDVYDHLLGKYMPPSLLVDENRELVDSFGGAEKLLRLPSRRPSLDVLELVDPSLRTR